MEEFGVCCKRKMRVIDSRLMDEGIRRTRACTICNRRVTTFEIYLNEVEHGRPKLTIEQRLNLAADIRTGRSLLNLIDDLRNTVVDTYGYDVLKETPQPLKAVK